jgi:Skp family chaperone for outer membrane proteins
MSSLIALLAGAVAKLYDDLEDNNFLQKFRNSTLMEFLKGLHYISFTTLSIEEPMFFVLNYLYNIVHSFGNKEGYSQPYEHSLLYSFLLLFIIIDYKKITSFCLIDKLIILAGILMSGLEPLVFNFDSKDSEYSFGKMKGRIITMILQIIICYFSISNTTKYITSYIIGYLFISVLVQLYSLRMEKLKIEIEKEEKEVKEVKEIEEKEIEKKKIEKEIEEKETEEKEIEKETEEKEIEKETEEKEKEIEEKEIEKEK